MGQVSNIIRLVLVSERALEASINRMTHIAEVPNQLVGNHLNEDSPMSIPEEQLESLYSLIRNINETQSSCSLLLQAANALRIETDKESRENFDCLEHREKGVNTIYKAYLEEMRQLLVSSEQLAQLSDAYNRVADDLPEMDRDWIIELQEIMDTLGSLPEDAIDMEDPAALEEQVSRAKIQWGELIAELPPAPRA